VRRCGDDASRGLRSRCIGGFEDYQSVKRANMLQVTSTRIKTAPDRAQLTWWDRVAEVMSHGYLLACLAR
jgi:hypothetical protein